MSSELFTLFFRRKFLPFFIAQFLGAFNDNLFKTALSLLIAFNVSQQAERESSILVNLAAISFILPFFIFSPRAGLLADQLNKVRLIQRIKLFEILIMSVAVLGFYFNNAWFLIGVLFLMGTQSAFFGPLKYSYLPTVLPRKELVTSNAWIQASTFIGIILGMMLAGFLFALMPAPHYPVMIAITGFALFGWIASRFMPGASQMPKTTRESTDSVVSLLKVARGQPDVWPSILGISWFWMLGATYITQLPNFVRYYVKADEQVFLFCLSLFAVGIGVGALLCAWLRRFQIERYSVLLGIIGLMVAGSVVAYYPVMPGENLRNIAEFGSSGFDKSLVVGLFFLGITGGLYIVPLYTVLQTRSDDQHRSRMVAANNVLNATYMIVSAIFVLLLLGFGLSISGLFLLLALSNMTMMLYFYRQNHAFLFHVDELFR